MMEKKTKIIGIGIATMDIYCHQNKMYPGGNEYNIAYNAKLLGAQAGFMGVFANDRVGDILESTLIMAGIDTSHSHHEQGSSGYALVDLVDGDRVFLDWNKEGVTDLYPFMFTMEEINYINSFDVACISWGARVNKDKIRKLSQAGVKICYDFYDNFTEREIEEIAPYVKYAFFSCSHLTEEETKEALKKSVDLGVEIALGTRGSDASIAFDGNTYILQDVQKVKAKDTMGAGDSYISAFLTNYLSAETDEPITVDNKIKTAMQKASEFAASVVVKDGSLGIGYDVDPNNLSTILNI